MKKITVFFIGLFLLHGAVFPQKVSLSTYRQLWKLAAAFPNQTQISIGITDGGVRRYYGFKKLKDTLVPVNNQRSVFGIGSVTKVFTALLICDQVYSGKMKLEDDIQRFYAFKLNKTVPVSLQSILTHTSGLPRGPSNFSSPYTPKKLHVYLKNLMTLSYDTTGKFRYSNLGFIVLGDILQMVTAKTYLALLKEKILIPFNMNATSTEAKAFKKGIIEMGRDTNGYPLLNHNFFSYQSAGALLSNVPDLLNFIEYSFIKQHPATAKFRLAQKLFYHQNKNASIRLGWQIHHMDHDTIYTHSGAVAGYTASIKYSKNRNRGVVVLSNLSGYGRLTDQIDFINHVFLTEE